MHVKNDEAIRDISAQVSKLSKIVSVSGYFYFDTEIGMLGVNSEVTDKLFSSGVLESADFLQQIGKYS